MAGHPENMAKYLISYGDENNIQNGGLEIMLVRAPSQV